MNTVDLNNAIHRLRYDIYLDDEQGRTARHADIESVSHELGLAEDTINRLVGALSTEVNGPTLMGEPVLPHPDDIAVDSFARALKEKLAASRTKGRGGWNTDEPGMQQRLSDMLRGHLMKGDPRDVANFCMFLHQRGEAILPPDSADCAAIMTEPYERWVTRNWHRHDPDAEPNALRDLLIMGLGIGGEAGEVQELIKKMVRDGREIRDDLRLELGDVLHYLTRIAARFGMTLPEIMAANRDKIDRRHASRETR